MDEATRTGLRGRFDAAAAPYAASRPGYPGEAVDWLLGGRRGTVLDLAAGTGALTRLLVPRSAAVVAAEPSANLLAELRVTLPDTPSVRAAAESLPFPDGSFDVVTVATAFHWFDPRLALPEIARVLRPQGIVSLAWNTRVHASGWPETLDRLLKSVQPPSLRGDWGTGSSRALVDSPLFRDVEVAEFEHAQLLDRAGLRALVGSRSYVIALSENVRRRVLAETDAIAETYADDSGRLSMPYRCQCWRARSVAPAGCIQPTRMSAAKASTS